MTAAAREPPLGGDEVAPTTHEPVSRFEAAAERGSSLMPLRNSAST